MSKRKRKKKGIHQSHTHERFGCAADGHYARQRVLLLGGSPCWGDKKRQPISKKRESKAKQERRKERNQKNFPEPKKRRLRLFAGGQKETGARTNEIMAALPDWGPNERRQQHSSSQQPSLPVLSQKGWLSLCLEMSAFGGSRCAVDWVCLGGDMEGRMMMGGRDTKNRGFESKKCGKGVQPQLDPMSDTFGF